MENHSLLVFTGESSFQGFLGGAKWISSIHSMYSTLVAVDPPAKSSSLFGGLVRKTPLISTKRLKSKDPTIETSSFKDEIDAKKFSPPGPRGPRPTDFLYSARTVVHRSLLDLRRRDPKTNARHFNARSGGFANAGLD